MRPGIMHLSAEQIDVLRSHVRADMYCALEVLGQASIREIAKFMARPADGLYHHMRLLENAGLVEVVATRKSGKRDEAIYDRAAEEIGLKPGPWDEQYAAAASRFLANMGRVFGDDCEQAVEKVAGSKEANKNVPAFFRRHKLKPEHVKELRERIWELDAWLTSVADPEAGTYSVIAGAVPAYPRKSSKG
jgi:predicted ArsR family transcriptional regulator